MACSFLAKWVVLIMKVSGFASLEMDIWFHTLSVVSSWPDSLAPLHEVPKADLSG